MRHPVPAGKVTVVWSVDPVSWEREVHRPEVLIGIGHGMVVAGLREVNELRRKLTEVVFDIEEARTWL